MAVIGDVGVYAKGFNKTGANREDLLNEITNIDPFDTPFMATCPKVEATGVLHEWLVDTLAATSTAGAKEGDAWTLGTTTMPTRVNNHCQIFRKDIAVTGSQIAVNTAGIRNDYTYEMEKATKEIARNMETTCFADLTSSTGNSNSARVMKTFQDFITTNTAYPASLGAAATAGVLQAVDINDMLQTIYTAGGNPDSIFCSPAVKRRIGDLTITGQNRNIAASERKLIQGFDVYDTDFGLIAIVMDRFIPQATNTSTAGSAASDVTGTLFVLERAKARWAWLRPVHHEYVGKLGDSVAGMVLGEGTLEVLSEKANGMILAVNNKQP